MTTGAAPADLPDQLARHQRWLATVGAEGRQLDLHGADLAGGVFDDADLSEAILIGARLSGASLRRSRLVNADLTAAALTGADLSGAVLIKAQLDRVDGHGLRLVGADLTRCSLVNARLQDADLDRSSLARTHLRGADLRGCTFRDARFDRAVITRALLATRDATSARGAVGDAIAEAAYVEQAGDRRSLDPEDLMTWWRSCGADVEVTTPRAPSGPTG